jgi:diguanylate cyclase (GGDEF)-like protein
MRHFQSVLSQELQRAGRFNRPLAVLMIDVDHLREINTARGHLAGDRALKAVASALQSATREYDVAARFGETSSASSFQRPTSKAPSSWPSGSEASSRARPPIRR